MLRLRAWALRRGVAWVLSLLVAWVLRLLVAWGLALQVASRRRVVRILRLLVAWVLRLLVAWVVLRLGKGCPHRRPTYATTPPGQPQGTMGSDPGPRAWKRI